MPVSQQVPLADTATLLRAIERLTMEVAELRRAQGQPKAGALTDADRALLQRLLPALDARQRVDFTTAECLAHLVKHAPDVHVAVLRALGSAPEKRLGRVFRRAAGAGAEFGGLRVSKQRAGRVGAVWRLVRA